MLDASPEQLPSFVNVITDSVQDGSVLRLLDPFVQAVEFIRTRDLAVLERLFPEVRRIVVDIVRRVAPELDDLMRPATD